MGIIAPVYKSGKDGDLVENSRKHGRAKA